MLCTRRMTSKDARRVLANAASLKIQAFADAAAVDISGEKCRTTADFASDRKERSPGLGCVPFHSTAMLAGHCASLGGAQRCP
jgi:hypothetical protein